MLMRFTYLYWKASHSPNTEVWNAWEEILLSLILKNFHYLAVILFVFKSSPEGKYYSIFPIRNKKLS